MAEAEVDMGAAAAERDGENEAADAFLVGWALPLEVIAKVCDDEKALPALPAPALFFSFLLLLMAASPLL
jgi:hypothetical protein